VENRQTNRQKDATERPTHAGGYAGVGNTMFSESSNAYAKLCLKLKSKT